MKDLKELEESYKQLGEEIQKLKENQEKSKKRWRASSGETYWIINLAGLATSRIERDYPADENLHITGNYFRTIEEARKSSIYSVTNSDYYYSFPWDEDKDRVSHSELPEGAKYWNEDGWGNHWGDVADLVDDWKDRVTYRWRK